MTAKADPATKTRDSRPLMTAKEEFAQLLKTIEESSRHARGVLFVLVVASMYVVLSAFSASEDQMIELPILNVQVSVGAFFVCGPLLILIAYLYLHIYVQDLQDRLREVYSIRAARRRSLVSLENMLYPWIFVFAFRSRRLRDGRRPEAEPDDDPDGTTHPDAAGPSLWTGLLIELLAGIGIWILGPAVLLVLWLRFMGEERIVALVPWACFVLSLFASRAFVWTSKAMRVAFVVVTLVTLAITLFSVEDLRSPLGLDYIWESAQRLSWSSWIFAVVVPLELAPAFALLWNRVVRSASYPEQRDLAQRLQETCFNGVWAFVMFPAMAVVIALKTTRVAMAIPKRVADDLLEGASIESMSFREVDFSGANLSRSKLSRCSFEEARLQDTGFQDAVLNECSFRAADLTGANLRDARMERANLKGAKLGRAIMKSARLRKANLKKALLTEVSLDYADLTGARLDGADLSKASLQGARLTGARLQGAVLDGADLRGTDITGAQVNSAASHAEAKLPWDVS